MKITLIIKEHPEIKILVPIEDTKRVSELLEEATKRAGVVVKELQLENGTSLFRSDLVKDVLENGAQVIGVLKTGALQTNSSSPQTDTGYTGAPQTDSPLTSTDLPQANSGPKHITLLGRVGHGKSSFGNTIFKIEEEFVTKISVGGCTTKCESKQGYWNGDSNDLKMIITDTPGLQDKAMPEEKIIQMLADSILSFSLAGDGKGVTAFCVCISGLETRVPETELQLMAAYENLLGKDLWKHTVLIITGCDPNLSDDLKERNDFCVKSFPEEFSKKFKYYLPTFRTSKKLLPNSLELQEFKKFLIQKSTFYSCQFFQEIKLAYNAGGYLKALTHAKQTITLKLNTFIKNFNKK